MIQMSLFMRLVWPLLVLGFGTALVVYAGGLSERCSAWIAGLRGAAPAAGSKPMSTRIMVVVFRLVGMYVMLAAAIGLFGMLLTR